MLALDLFSERGFRWANLGQLLYGTGFTIMFFGNVQFLGDVWGYSPVRTGLAMAPGPLVVFLLAPRFGKLAGRIGQRPILIPGGLIYAAAAVLLLSRVDSAPGYLAVWLPYILLSGIGVSMVFPMLTSAAVAGLPSDRFATGSAVNAALRALGQTLGVAIFVAVVGRAAPGELLAHHQLAWWLVAAAGVAVTATSWWLPRVASATRPLERRRWLTVPRMTTTSSPSTIVAGRVTARSRHCRQDRQSTETPHGNAMAEPTNALLYLDDLHVGRRFTSGTHALDERQITTFASEFDPQPFHTDREAAKETLFRGLAASGWHTAAITMRLQVDGGLPITGGLVGLGGEVAWPTATRPGDVLHVESEILEVVPSRSRPDRGTVTVRSETRNQRGEVVQRATIKLLVPRGSKRDR